MKRKYIQNLIGFPFRDLLRGLVTSPIGVVEICPSLGPELVKNGTFDTDTANWTNTSADIASVSGELQVSNQTGSPSTTTQSLSNLISGATYEVTCTSRMEGTGGNVARASFFGTFFASANSPTPVTETVDIVASGTAGTMALQSFGTSDTIYVFDNVSVRQKLTVYDVFLLVGQSNMGGRADYDSLGLHPSGTFQWDQANALVAASVPLDHPSQPGGTMGLDITFADDYRAAFSTNPLLYVPSAVGSTGFADNNWNQGDVEYEAAVDRVNATLAAFPCSRFRGILWLQGEQDAFEDNALTESEYATALDAMIAAMRSDITGASNTPFVAGQIPDISGGFFPTNDEVNDAIADLPNRVANTAVALNTGLTKLGDGLHYDAASLRTMGERIYTAYATL